MPHHPARLFLIIAMAPLAGATPILIVHDLGSTGGTRATGAAINAAGQVVGYGTNALNDYQAFSSFSTLAPMPGGSSASAFGINGNSDVVGNVYLNGEAKATLWVNGAARQLGGLGGPDSYAMAINNRDQAVGMATTPDGAGHAVLYSGGSARSIAPSGSWWSAAYAINDNGSIAGNAMDADMNARGFVVGSGGYTRLGTLGGVNSYAFGINSNGQVVGNSSTASGYSHAFLWNGAGMSDLGTLGGTSSYAYGINAAGAVVGYSNTGGGVQRAFLFSNQVMYDLNSLVTNLAGWQLTQAYGINDRGQVTGAGLLNGVEHAFLLDPAMFTTSSIEQTATAPEPASLGLLALGLGAIFAGGRLARR